MNVKPVRTARLESLESRTLFSVTIDADVAAIQNDQLAIKETKIQGAATIKNDQLTLAADKRGNAAAVQAAVSHRTVDLADFKALFAADRANIAATQLADKQAVSADILAVRANVGNAFLEAAAKLQLASDRAKVVTDVNALRAVLLRDQANQKATIKADNLEIAGLRRNGSPTVVSDKATLASDRAILAATLKAETAQLVVDRRKLAADRRAGL